MSAYHNLAITKEAEGAHWLTRLVRWAFECRHDWDITACNGFGTPIEEQCDKCGMYQHRVLKSEKLHEHTEWVLGRHPQSSAHAAVMPRPTTPNQ